MTSNAKLKCVTKFDWVEKNVRPIKFHIYINFFAFDNIIRKVYSIYETNTNSRIFFSHIDFKKINVKKNLGNRIFV